METLRKDDLVVASEVGNILHKEGTKAYCLNGHHVATVTEDIKIGVECYPSRCFNFTHYYRSNGNEEGGYYVTECKCGASWIECFIGAWIDNDDIYKRFDKETNITNTFKVL